MDEKTIQQYSKELTLGFLDQIKASVKESEGIYSITIPQEFSTLFGGNTKRITFDQEIAATHSCDLVVPASKFLSVIMEEIKKQAPVVVGSVICESVDPLQFLNKIKSHNCTINMQSSSKIKKFGIRFYFNITLKSIHSISQLQWLDISLDTLDQLNFPTLLKLEPIDLTNFESPDNKVDVAYAKSIQIVQTEIESMARKYVELTRNKIQNDVEIVNRLCNKRIDEAKEDLNHVKLQLKDYDRKIRNARNSQTMAKHAEQREKIASKLKEQENEVVDRTIALTRERDNKIAEIETRYKPTIEFSLVAAQLYVFDILDCNLLLKNEKLEKQITTTFISPILTFMIKCELCENTTDSIHLCINSHMSCDSCILHCINCKADLCINCKAELTPCYICKEGLCTACIGKCKFCSEISCSKHSMKCNHCSEMMCFFCQGQCAICSKISCNPSLQNCSACHDEICSEHTSFCFHCNRVFCSQHQKICSICNNTFCESSQTQCKICEQKYSSNCVSKNICLTCMNLTETDHANTTIRELVSKYPQYAKSKKWKLSTNNKYHIFRMKRLFGHEIIVYDKESKKIILVKKGSMF